MDAEDQDLQRQVGRTSNVSGDMGETGLPHQAPADLLPTVLHRIAALDAYLAPDCSPTALRQAAADPRWEVRTVALRRLAAVAPLDAAELLVAALDDVHPAVRDAAHGALSSLSAPLSAVAQPGTAAPAPATATVPHDSAPHTALSAAAIARSRIISWRAACEDGIGALAHGGRVLARQPRLLRREWGLPSLALLFADALVVFVALRLGVGLRAAATALALATILAAAIISVSTANLALDPGAELAASTGTSPRLVLGGRFALVVGTTLAISGLASAIMALAFGQGLWGIVQLWLGPLLLLAAVTLMVAQWLGTWLGLLATLGLEAAGTLRIGADGLLVPLEHSILLQTNPVILCLAALCCALALVGAPRPIPQRLGSFQGVPHAR